MQWIREHQADAGRERLYRRALLITIGGNMLLAAAKGLVAYLSGSVALYADAANSVSDVLYSLLMMWGLWISLRPPDLSHPQGHSRFEPLVGLTVSLAMAFAGYQAARMAVERFLAGGLAVAPGLPTLVLIVSAGIKYGMYAFISGLAGRLDSPALHATARDNLSDVLTSVAALVGALGSAFVHPLLDPLGGLLVALWIFRAVFFVARENLHYLTGGGASEELLQEIATAAGGVQGVQRVHQVITEYAGPQLLADLHINVEGCMPLREAHAIADEVQTQVEALPEVDRAYIHLEPCDEE